MLDEVDPKLSDEPARLSALARAQIAGTAPEEPFDKITRLVRDVLGMPIAAVTLIDADTQWHKSREGLAAESCAREDSFCTHAIQSRAVMIVHDALEDPRVAASPLVTNDPMIRAYIGAPIATPDGYNLGALCAMDIRPRPDLGPAEGAVLESFARLVEDQIELRRVASTDPLTGAATRRVLTEAMAAALADADRRGERSSLVTLDLDRFKSINDTYGHGAGDEVLREVARRLRARCRAGDTFGRLGGEEFAVLMQGADAGAATRAAERLRAAVAAEPVEAAGVSLAVTASFGIAELPARAQRAEDAGQAVKDWLAAADGALYAAKERGRDCVACAPPGPD